MEPLTIALLCVLGFVGAAILAFGIILGLALRSAVLTFGKHQKWIWDRFLTLLEPDVARRIQEIQEAEREEDEVEGEAAEPEEPTPYRYG
jgi:hypothetical protein